MLSKDKAQDTGQEGITSNQSCNTQQTVEKVSSNNSNTGKRMSVNLAGEAARLLEFLAETQGITQIEALRKAIATEAYLLEERMQGSKVLLQTSDKEVREVIFR